MKVKDRNKGGITGSKKGVLSRIAETTNSRKEWPELLHALWSGQIDQEQVLVALFGHSECGQASKASVLP